MKFFSVLVCTLLSLHLTWANVITSGPSDFRSQIDLLTAGDTLYLLPGDYTQSLRLEDLSGTENEPILISGQPNTAKPVFLGNACCNTISLTRCEFLELRDLICDGQNVAGIDALKAEGTSGNWTHDIVIQGLEIIGYGASQQNVGISTKCPSWNWHVHHNIIEAAGTGFYFGNSDGEDPFVNGLIEYNLIQNTVGYCGQVKHQNANTRDVVLGMPSNAKTTIRYNVLSKDQNASSGANARPNLLVGNFPAVGAGANDFYEIYGNFFFQNPSEGLFQGTGNIGFYDNLLFNSAGGWGVSIQTHKGFAPRNIDIFSNTVLISDNWGFSLSGADPSFQQHLTGNAIFAPTPISGFTGSDNVSDAFGSATAYLRSPLLPLSALDLTPHDLSLLMIDHSLNEYQSYGDFNLDFDGNLRDGQNAGAYSTNAQPAWMLQMGIRTLVEQGSTTSQVHLTPSEISIYPCPADDFFVIEGSLELYDIVILDSSGLVYDSLTVEGSQIVIDIQDLPNGLFFIQIDQKNSPQLLIRKILKAN